MPSRWRWRYRATCAFGTAAVARLGDRMQRKQKARSSTFPGTLREQHGNIARWLQHSPRLQRARGAGSTDVVLENRDDAVCRFGYLSHNDGAVCRRPAGSVDPLQRGGDQGVVALGNLVEPAPDVGPAIGQGQLLRRFFLGPRLLDFLEAN